MEYLKKGKAMTVAASERLRTALGLIMDEAPADGGRFWAHPRLRVLYPRYLVMLHTLIRGNVTLMTAARDAARQTAPADPTGLMVAEYMDKHLEEERHHDDWLLDDLEVLGVPRQDVLTHVPSPAVAALSGSQFYYVQFYRPVAILGYVAILEGRPPTKILLDAARRRTGYPEEAFAVLRMHGEFDPGHIDDMYQLLDSLPLDSDAQLAIMTNAMATHELARRIMTELMEEHPMTVLRSERVPA